MTHLPSYIITIQVNVKISDSLQDNKIDAVICVAGGWAGGNSASKGH